MREQEEQQIATALRGVPLFRLLNERQARELARVAHRYRYGAGQRIVTQGDSGDSFYVILSGQVKVSVMSPEGQEAILVVLDAGEGFGEFALLDDQPRSATIEATQPTEAVALRKDDFTRLLRQMPDIAIGLLKVLTKRLRDTDQLVQDAAFLDVGDRLAKKLLTLMDTHGRPGPQGSIELNLRLTQGELASMIGATRESVNKQLGAFRNEGVVAIDRQRIVILRPQSLRDRVGAFE